MSFMDDLLYDRARQQKLAAEYDHSLRAWTPEQQGYVDKATESVRQWPAAALTWPLDLVDMLASGAQGLAAKVTPYAADIPATPVAPQVRGSLNELFGLRAPSTETPQLSDPEKTIPLLDIMNPGYLVNPATVARGAGRVAGEAMARGMEGSGPLSNLLSAARPAYAVPPEGFQPASTLGVALGRGPQQRYTLKTLERLPQNKTEFSPLEIQNLVKQQDVTGPERVLLTDIINEARGQPITATQLVAKARLGLEPYALTPKSVEQSASYGLSNIRGREKDRLPSGRMDPNAPMEHLKPSTNLWNLPSQYTDANHFEEPNLFGWSRSFEDVLGTPHVTELQSDLMQHIKPLTPEKRVVLEEQFAGIEQQTQELAQRKKRALEEEEKSLPARGYHRRLREAELWRELTDEAHKLSTRRREIKAALHTADITNKVLTTIPGQAKLWPRRLIRETLHDAAVKGKPIVNFATADTAAKVEGWPLDPVSGQFTDPGHQSIYNRYSDEITKFLKSQGGTLLTDSAGHTWWSVPTAPHRKRIEAFGLGASSLGGGTLEEVFNGNDN